MALALPPAPSGHINDYAQVLSASDVARLEALAVAEERRSGNQLAVAIFPSLEDESIDDYTNRLFQHWRLGRKGLDNGVLLTVFLKERKLRIEVGYGLEGRLTDATATLIRTDIITPKFREGR